MKSVNYPCLFNSIIYFPIFDLKRQDMSIIMIKKDGMLFMNKILGMMIPYIILVCVGFMQSALIEKALIAFVVGLLIGIEFLNLKKAEGTVLMKLGKIFTIFIFIVGFLLGMLNPHLLILPDLTNILALSIPLECIGLYMLYQNHPRYTMTYKYSFKNKRRRYF